MAIPYTPPGISIVETVSPSVSVSLTSPADLCLVGLPGTLTDTQTPLTAVDVVALSGTGAHVLPSIAELNNNAQLIAVQSVTDVLDPSVGTPPGSGYTVTTDYTVGLGEGPPDGNAATISRVSGGTIPNGALVQVTYTYVPSDYWNPIRLFDIASAESRFGPSWATATNPTTGQTYFTGVYSQLSMAARLAFANGVQSVICQPLFARSTPGDPTTAQIAPTNVQVGDVATWGDTLYSLRSIENIGLIVPVVGQDGTDVTDSSMLSIFTKFQEHQVYMNGYNQPIIAIFGEDGTEEGIGNVNSGLMHTVRVHAASLQANFPNSKAPVSSQCALINNTVFQITPPGGTPGISSATVIDIGGQYCAAAVAGALAARSTSTALTRQPVSGFQSISDPRTPDDKNADAGSGLMVIEQIQGVVRCRQSNTLNLTGGPSQSEISVVRAKAQLVQSVQSLLDNQIIGSIIADANSPVVVSSAIAGVLTLLQQQGVIVGYTAPTAALTSLNPTTITASFSYQPAFPVNYIKISFALDLTSGQITVAG